MRRRPVGRLPRPSTVSRTSHRFVGTRTTDDPEGRTASFPHAIATADPSQRLRRRSECQHTHIGQSHTTSHRRCPVAGGATGRGEMFEASRSPHERARRRRLTQRRLVERPLLERWSEVPHTQRLSHRSRGARTNDAGHQYHHFIRQIVEVATFSRIVLLLCATTAHTAHECVRSRHAR